MAVRTPDGAVACEDIPESGGGKKVVMKIRAKIREDDFGNGGNKPSLIFARIIFDDLILACPDCMLGRAVRPLAAADGACART